MDGLLKETRPREYSKMLSWQAHILLYVDTGSSTTDDMILSSAVLSVGTSR